jgi:hypothetical protein
MKGNSDIKKETKNSGKYLIGTSGRTGVKNKYK